MKISFRNKSMRLIDETFKKRKEPFERSRRFEEFEINVIKKFNDYSSMNKTKLQTYFNANK